MYNPLVSFVALALVALCASATASNTTAVPTTIAVKKGATPDLVYPDFDAIITCSDQDCSGTCQYTPIAELDPFECDLADFGFRSAMAYTIDGEGLDVGVYVGLSDCDDPVQLETVDTCYNLFVDDLPADFRTFYIT